MKKSVLVALAVVCGVLSVCGGETYYMAKSNDSKTRTAPFTDPSYWKDASGTVQTNAAIFSKDNDFIIAGDKRLRTNAISSFKAHSLTVGNPDLGKDETGFFQHDSGNLNFSGFSGGLILAKGGSWEMNTWTSGHETLATLWELTMSGEITVTSPASSPFVFQGYQYAFRRDVFTGAVHGAAGTGFKLVPVKEKKKESANQYQSFGFRDLSGYFGDIEITMPTHPLINEAFAMGIEFGSTTFPGSLKLDGLGGAIRLLDKTNEVTIANLEMGDLSRIVVQNDGKTTGLITVTNSYVQTGKVILECFPAVPMPGERIPILRVPYAAAISGTDFIATNRFLDAEVKKLATLFPDEGFPGATYEVAVEEDAAEGTKTVCLVVPTKLATLTVDDSESWSTKSADLASSVYNAANWSDGSANHTNDICFLNGHRLRTPYVKEAVVFPGERLVMDGSSSASFIFNAPGFTIDWLYLTAPSVYFYVCNGTSGPKLKGKRMYMSENTTLHIYSYTGSVLKFSPEIVGGGTIKTHGRSSTSSYTHYIELANFNTNWLGSIWLQADKGSSLPFPNYSMGFPRLYLSDGRNLGGRLPAFKYDALRLCHYARLYPRNAVTLEDGLNRGVCVDGAAVFNFDAGNDITINQPLTVGGTIYKVGTGTLALGGELKFLNYSDPYGSVTNTWRLYSPNGSNETVRTYGDVTIADMPDPRYADLSFLAVSNGYLKVAHVDAVNGLKVDFTPASKAKTGLKLDLNPADADLRLYGVRNVKTDTPFAGTVNVTFDTVNAVDEDIQIMTNGVFTVKTEKYAETRAQFKVAPPKVKGCRAKEVTFTSGANGEYTTFGYEYERHGLAILVR